MSCQKSKKFLTNTQGGRDGIAEGPKAHQHKRGRAYFRLHDGPHTTVSESEGALVGTSLGRGSRLRLRRGQKKSEREGRHGPASQVRLIFLSHCFRSSCRC